jgi:hypothetical protein
MERKWQLRTTSHKKKLMAMAVVMVVDVNNGTVMVVIPTTITFLLSPTQLACDVELGHDLVLGVETTSF